MNAMRQGVSAVLISRSEDGYFAGALAAITLTP